MKKLYLFIVLFVLVFVIYPQNVLASDVTCTYDLNENNNLGFDAFNSILKFTVKSDGSILVSDSVPSLEFDRRTTSFKTIFDKTNACPAQIYQCRKLYLIKASNGSPDGFTMPRISYYIYDYIPENSETLGSSIQYNCVLYNLNKTSDDIIDIDPTPPTCEGLLGTALLEKLQFYFNILKIAVPIIIIVMSTLDFSKSVFGSDNDEMKKAQNTLVKRLILAVLFFLLPIIINFLLHLINNNITNCNIK